MNLSHLGQIDETDHDLDHLRSSPAVARGSAGSVQYRSIQIQPRKPVLGHAGYTAPTRQHGLDHTVQIRNLSALKILDRDVAIDYLSAVRTIFVEAGLSRKPP